MSVLISTLMIYLWLISGSMFTLRRLDYLTEQLYNPKLTRKKFKTQYNIWKYICAPLYIAKHLDSKFLTIVSYINLICIPLNIIIVILGMFLETVPLIAIILICLSYIIITTMYLSNLIVIIYISRLGESVYPIIYGLFIPSLGYYLLSPVLVTFFRQNKNILRGDE